MLTMLKVSCVVTAMCYLAIKLINKLYMIRRWLKLLAIFLPLEFVASYKADKVVGEVQAITLLTLIGDHRILTS